MTDCNCCGSCCDPVWLNAKSKQALDVALTYPHMVEDIDTKLNANFAARNWKLVYEQEKCGEKFFGFACRFFDKLTRLCTAHDKRPPVCQGYPFYGQEPTSDMRLPQGCSYWADIPLPEEAIKVPVIDSKDLK